MNDAINDSGDPAMSPPPPPPPPPAAARGSRRQLISRKGAAVAVASGLVVGGVAGGYMISQAATTASPSATAAPAAPGATDRPHGFAGAGPAARTQDLQQVASVIGITATQLQTEMVAGKTIAAIATEHNVNPTKVIAALVTDENAEIDAAATAGTITSAEASQMKATTTQRVTDLVNDTRSEHGFGGHGGLGGSQAEDQQVIAAAIGITTTQLQTELTAGKTIAAIATEHNATSAAVVGALVTSENKEIDARVAAGQLTAAEGATQKSQTQQRVTDLVNGARPAGGPGGWLGGPPPNAPASSSN